MISVLLWSLLAFAGSTWSVESSAQAEKSNAEAMRQQAEKLGYTSRVVRRFHLGEGWGWVVLVDGFDAEGTATGAARRLADANKVSFAVVETAGKPGSKKTTEVAASTPETVPQTQTAADVVAKVLGAHGGPGGGSATLSRASAVHFAFERSIERAGAAALVVQHDYWREGSGRRLVVSPAGIGEKSVAVATSTAAWVAAAGKVEPRDIGVVVNQADAFAPETVLSVALDVATLLAAPEGLLMLEGAEKGVRVGRGEDPSEPGLAYFDADVSSGLLLSVRYVTEGGPVEFTYDGWRTATPSVLFPSALTLTRPDSSIERVRVTLLEVSDHAPAGSFDAPSPP